MAYTLVAGSVAQSDTQWGWQMVGKWVVLKVALKVQSKAS